MCPIYVYPLLVLPGLGWGDILTPKMVSIEFTFDKSFYIIPFELLCFNWYPYSSTGALSKTIHVFNMNVFCASHTEFRQYCYHYLALKNKSTVHTLCHRTGMSQPMSMDSIIWIGSEQQEILHPCQGLHKVRNPKSVLEDRKLSQKKLN